MFKFLLHNRSFKNCENYGFKLYPKDDNKTTKWNNGLETSFTFIKLNNIEIEEIDNSIFAKWNHTQKCIKNYTISAEEKNGCDCFSKEFIKLDPKINSEIAINLTEKLELKNCQTYIITIIPNLSKGSKDEEVVQYQDYQIETEICPKSSVEKYVIIGIIIVILSGIVIGVLIYKIKYKEDALSPTDDIQLTGRTAIIPC